MINIHKFMSGVPTEAPKHLINEQLPIILINNTF